MSLDVEIREARVSDIEAILSDLRPADDKEIRLMGFTPRIGLYATLNTSIKAWTGLINGEPVSMFGLTEGCLGAGKPWMIGTTCLEKHAVAVLRRCRPMLDEMRQMRILLENYVHVDNHVSIKWLRWLGFDIDNTPLRYCHGQFYYFHMRRPA